MSTPGFEAPFSLEEKLRQGFMSGMRSYVLNDLSGFMHDVYEERVLPGFERANSRAPANGEEVHKAMRSELIFKFYSAMRCTVQEMCWRSVIPGVERGAQALTAKAREISEPAVASGRAALEVDPNFQTPRYVSELDVHLMPGNYHEEHLPGDVSQGIIYETGFDVFSMGLLGEKADDIGRSVSYYVSRRFPDLKPKRILDLGCLIGHSTIVWKELYPDAEVHGVDVGAPGIRFAHARAQSYGLDIHFHQQDAIHTKFEDGSFDIVYSSMFLHELPPSEFPKLMQEIRRLLRPGGLMVHYELPPNSMMEAYDSFYLDWDSYYNKEPFYKASRDADMGQLMEDAGFAREDQFFAAVPSIGAYGPQVIADSVTRNDTGPDERTSRLVKGMRWFCFGAAKHG